MAINLKGRSLLTLKDYTPGEIQFLLGSSGRLKEEKTNGPTGESLGGQKYRSDF